MTLVEFNNSRSEQASEKQGRSKREASKQQDGMWGRNTATGEFVFGGDDERYPQPSTKGGAFVVDNA